MKYSSLTSVHHDTKLIVVFQDALLIHLQVSLVDVAIQEPLMYFESLEVEGVDVHFEESFSHAINTVCVVSVLVAVHISCDNHVHMVSVCNISHLLFRHKRGLSGCAPVHCERSRGWNPGAEDACGCFRRNWSVTQHWSNKITTRNCHS
jgi:hypothetical protein